MKMAVLVWVVLVSPPALAQGLQISPSQADQLEGVLKTLGERHRIPLWCSDACATFFELIVEGSLARGEVRFVLTGAVTAEQKAYVPLFGTRPAVGLDEASLAGRRLPIYWSGSAYSAVLEPGEFTISGTMRFGEGVPLTLRVPGPIGEVSIRVTDAEVVGTGERRGVRQATYQLTPREHSDASTRDRLRLHVARDFHLARDRSFTVTISARGAKPGQVIPITLMSGEAVEDLDPRLANLREKDGERWLEWVASGPSPELTYSGKWQADAIPLVAPTGTVKETWTVHCDDPYLCSFTGDAEKLLGVTGHVWAPLPGQKLEVSWRELESLRGVHTVAQQVSLASKAVGRNLQQRLRVDWLSSSGSLVAMRVPKGALMSRFELDGTAVPILRDSKGNIQISLPAGRSALQAHWELATRAGLFLRPLVPSFSEPVGTLWHRIYPTQGTTVIKTGGLSGSPRVALWPNMGACLAIAVLLWLLSRWGAAPISSPVLLLVAVLGFAIAHPLLSLPLALALGIGRWLARIHKSRHKVRIVLELMVWGSLVTAAIVTIFATLHHALFSPDPMEVTAFVSGGAAPAADTWGYGPLVWGTYLAGDPTAHATLPAPWILALPVIIVRLLWAAWAVVVAFFLLREGRLALGYLSAYWETARWTRASK